MKHLLLTAIILSISCNPFMSLNMMTGGAATNVIVDAITTDVIVRTINDSTKIEEKKIISIPTIMLNDFLKDAEEWISKFKYQGGYACLCAYFTVTKSKGIVIFDFLAKPVETGGFKWGHMEIPVTNEEWEEIKHVFPDGVVINTDVFVTFKK